MITDFAGLKALADQHSGNCKPFTQSGYMLRHGELDTKKGMCRALCAAFVKRNYVQYLLKDAEEMPSAEETLVLNELGGQKFFTDFSHQITENKPKTDELGRYAGLRRTQSVTAPDVKPITAEALVEAADFAIGRVSNQRLRQKSITVVVAGAKGVEDSLFSQDAFYLISTGEHMMAVSVRISGGAWRIKFFDPNRGQVLFTDEEEAAEFITEYLKDQQYGEARFILYG